MSTDKIEKLDWNGIESDLSTLGHARLGPLLKPTDCVGLAAMFDDDARFRATVEMARHGYGEGRYRYFADPPPELVGGLRAAFYSHLTPIANRMTAAMGRAERYPATLEEFRGRCWAAGQGRPTPLLLRYDAGGHNRLHRDLYGELLFPLQVAICLSKPGVDFTGGAFLLVEQSPRRQSRGEAIDLVQGEAVIFPTFERPVAGRRGTYRAAMRHGASRVLTGRRHVLGLIFHAAA